MRCVHRWPKSLPYRDFVTLSHLSNQVRHLSTPHQATQFAQIHTYLTSLTKKRGRPSTGIIYARARATCDDLSQYLRGKGLAVRPYHRGIPRSRLDKTLQEWADGEGMCDVVVSTIAFGLGIDKADVR